MFAFVGSTFAANTVSYGILGTGATATPIGTVVELYTPDGSTGYAYVRLNIPGGIALDAITGLTYNAKVINPDASGYAPEVILNIDANNDVILTGTGMDWMFSGHGASSIGADNFLSGDNSPVSAVIPDLGFVNRDALTSYNYWSTDDPRTGFASYWTSFSTILGSFLPAYGIDSTDKVYSIDFVAGTSGSFNGLRVRFNSITLNGVTYPVVPPYPRTAAIVAPTSGENVYGIVNFSAYLDDDDIDPIQWAVRRGTCAAGTNTVFGNVDGRSDVATINTSILSDQTISFTGDMSVLPLGMYCFIYNPVEDGGEAGLRETVQFNLVETPVILPTNKDQCKKGGWENFGGIFKNQGDCVSFVVTGGKNLPANQ